jgi:hypothetical protein
MKIKKLLLIGVVCINSLQQLNAQIIRDSLIIPAKIWRKDDKNHVNYSDWKNFSAVTVDMLSGFDAKKFIVIDKYGGCGKTYEVTGYFYTKNINGRWYVINPLGHMTYITAVNSIRTSKTAELPSKYKDIDDWGTQTLQQINSLGFNTAGCWSDVDVITKYNKTAANPMIYTLQLNLLSGYVTDTKKKNPDRKGTSSLGFILDDEFANYCEKKADKYLSKNTDPNLLGIFSDNELSFTTSEVKDIIKDKNNNDKAYLKLLDWLPKDSKPEDMTDEQKQQFIAYFAGQYYEKVSKAIKKVDKNHLYIGSRIHSNAKNNKFLFQAAEPYWDIISINYYGDWSPKQSYIEDWAQWSQKPFFVTEFYTKAEETGMTNKSGAGWIVKTQADRGVHYQNFCLQLLKAKNCVGWHWFRYQDDDPKDEKDDESKKDSNKGMVDLHYEYYQPLIEKMKELNNNVYQLINYFDRN